MPTADTPQNDVDAESRFLRKVIRNVVIEQARAFVFGFHPGLIGVFEDDPSHLVPFEVGDDSLQPITPWDYR